MSDLNELGKYPDGFERKDSQPEGIGLFFGEKERAFFSSAGREITESILEESFVLYRMDLKRTKSHGLYGEAKSYNKVWKEEIIVNGRINVESNDNQFHAEGGLVKHGYGNLTAHVYMEHLDELGLTELNLNQTVVYDINNGDFIGFKGQYYKIINNGLQQISNEFSWAGDRRFYITISAVEVDEDVFKAR